MPLQPRIEPVELGEKNWLLLRHAFVCRSQTALQFGEDRVDLVVISLEEATDRVFCHASIPFDKRRGHVRKYVTVRMVDYSLIMPAAERMES